jgi:hypothetical protein
MKVLYIIIFSFRSVPYFSLPLDYRHDEKEKHPPLHTYSGGIRTYIKLKTQMNLHLFLTDVF